MTTQIFVNLPVKNLAVSVDFFSHLGYDFEARFTNERAACMKVSDSIFVMLLVEEFFQTFTKKSVCDAAQSTEVLLALACQSRGEVDDRVAQAVAAGATTPKDSVDHGFMYQHGFEDLDGHMWELFYLKPEELVATAPGQLSG
ncbi:VOC family protein [Rhodoferax sp. PAMC 29310]|uniref:VOC family protein n=1 Tax=Rhodoferax sp. PAMC 29310 TaxID=2822760 RepID=UPI001B3444A7|nr:glyoxalase/bleomycin resistance/extradiol dioxygenase family protein [Rhodoferax sp. PAMC 29310]